MTAARCAGVALALVCAGCAGEREVRVHLPISRLELPEQGPRMFDITVGGTGEVEATLTRDQANVAPDPTAPELADENDGLLRFDASPHPMVTLTAKAASGLGGLQAKLMPLQGRGPFKLAFTLGYASGDDRFDFDDGNTRAYTTVDSRLRDYAMILGWKIDPTSMVYGGPWLSELSYDGHHFSDRAGNPDVEFDYRGDLRATGVNLGFSMGFRRWGRMLVEYSHANVEAGTVDDDVGHGSLSLEIFFGSLIGPRVEEPEEPVEVVPPKERERKGV